jgi:hypothetical protein
MPRAKVVDMSKDVLAPLTGPGIRIHDKAGLEEFLALPNATEAVQSSSFEQLFFTVKTVGLADSLALLPLVTGRQVCGFVDLDCWRKDSFVRKPFMEWIAAFVQVGPDETVRALSGIDENVIALFLKELITVYEIERDEPAPETELFYTPDNRFAVHQDETGELASIASLILDALFRHAPDMGYSLLRRVRYTTLTVLEETAYQNKVRRLEVDGFVDYYSALSIYAGPQQGETTARPRADEDEDDDEDAAEDAVEDERPRFLPTVFADSISEGGFLLAALGSVPASASDRLAQELTALGNRILSANLVNLGEVEGIRGALSEMRDYLTIGLECLSDGDLGSAPGVLTANHVQIVFKAGFDQLAGLRAAAEQLFRFPAFTAKLLESPDQEFYNGLLRFKPLFWEGGQYRNFQNVADVENARKRMDEIRIVSEGFLRIFPASETTLRKTFNTAVICLATSGDFEPRAIEAKVLEQFVSEGAAFPPLELPEELQETARIWLHALGEELEPLTGKAIDPRFVDSVLMRF